MANSYHLRKMGAEELAVYARAVDQSQRGKLKRRGFVKLARPDFIKAVGQQGLRDIQATTPGWLMVRRQAKPGLIRLDRFLDDVPTSPRSEQSFTERLQDYTNEQIRKLT